MKSHVKLADSTVVSIVDTAMSEQVAELLGRAPRGLRSASVCSASGDPVVIQVASLVDDKPFPTLFWLVDKRLNYAIDQVEAQGLIAELQTMVDDSEQLQASMHRDHHDHIALRERLMSEDLRHQLKVLGFESVLAKRGIGGIENFSRIRCLHTYYAAHLVVPNTVGRLLDEYWLAQGIVFDHLMA